MTLFLTLTALADQPKYRPTDAERGEELYRKHCVQCHGARNAGDGPVGLVLVSKVPDLVGKVDPRDPQVGFVLYGKGHMPGYEATFGKQDSVRVLKFMKDLGPDKELESLADKKKREAAEKKTVDKKIPKKSVPVKKKPEKKPEEKPPEDGPEREE